MANHWTHYRVMESLSEDDEEGRGEPFESRDDAIAYGKSLGIQYWSVYGCRQLQGPNGPWWFNASSYSYSSW